ncbi:hypothetical protein A9G12_02805 [Gilliamella sp. wkB112]|nr:hypothetical protein A9G12_02805 [Gilliamella apicola]
MGSNTCIKACALISVLLGGFVNLSISTPHIGHKKIVIRNSVIYNRVPKNILIWVGFTRIDLDKIGNKNKIIHYF